MAHRKQRGNGASMSCANVSKMDRDDFMISLLIHKKNLDKITEKLGLFPENERTVVSGFIATLNELVSHPNPKPCENYGKLDKEIGEAIQNLQDMTRQYQSENQRTRSRTQREFPSVPVVPGADVRLKSLRRFIHTHRKNQMGGGGCGCGEKHS